MLRAATNNRLSFIASGSIDGTTLAIPSGSQAGDICFFMDLPAKGTSGTPIDRATPTGVTGWTELSFYATNPRNDLAIFSYAKILASGDIGNSVTVTYPYGSTGGYRRKIIAVFRPSSPISNFAVFSIANEGTSGNPAPQTINASSGSVPLISIATYRATGSLTGVSFSPAETQSVTSGTTANVRFRIENEAPSNVTVDVGDSGNTTMLQSLYVEVY
jgi:hypothetical protein